MARLARSVFPGIPHHVAQRGNHGRYVFENMSDYQRYREWLRAYAERYGVKIWAYCLMSDQVDFVCVPETEQSLALTFNATHMRYAQYFNGKSAFRGSLWRARFMSCALDEPSLREDVRFIETIPLRAALVSKAEDYPWSSAQSHVMAMYDPLLSDGCSLTVENPDWRDYLDALGDEDIIRKTHEKMRTGRPAGEPDFVRRLEAIVGRRLEAMPRGRPRKSRKTIDLLPTPK